MTIGLLIAGGIAAFDAFRLAVHEEWRQRYGTTTTGTVTSRTTNSADSSIGAVRGRLPRGLDRLDRAAARWIRTQSADVWLIEFEYPSQGTRWRGADTVSPEKWAALRPGEPIAVRFDPSRADHERAALEGESDLPDAFAQAAVGTTLIAVAAVFSRSMKPRKARRRLSATALVTGVQTAGRARWEVEFAFFDDEGTKHECVQEFIRDIWKPGLEGLAEYEPERPHEAVIIPVPALMARGPAATTPGTAPPASGAAAPPGAIEGEETRPFHRSLMPALAWAVVWALVLAATGFVASIAAWTLYYPASPQGPMHAIFVAAPGGAMAGAFVGGFIRLVRAQWSWAQMCVALAIAVVIYAASLVDGWQRFAGA